jgi:hypothetical protein
MPLVRVKHPGRKERDAIGSSAMEGGAARRNWVAPAAPLVGEVEGEGLGLTRARFVCSIGGEGAAGGGGRRHQPVLAAAACCPAKDELARDNTQLHEPA